MLNPDCIPKRRLSNCVCRPQFRNSYHSKLGTRSHKHIALVSLIRSSTPVYRALCSKLWTMKFLDNKTDIVCMLRFLVGAPQSSAVVSPRCVLFAHLSFRPNHSINFSNSHLSQSLGNKSLRNSGA